MTTFHVTCATCKGEIDFLDDDPTRPVCAACSIKADLCTCLDGKVTDGRRWFAPQKSLTPWMVGQASPVHLTPEQLAEFTAALNKWLSSPREWMIETTTADMTDEQLGWRRVGPPMPQRPDSVSPDHYPPPRWMVGGFVFLFVLVVGLFLRVVVIG